MAQIALVDAGDQLVRLENDAHIDQTAGVDTGHRWIPVVTVSVPDPVPADYVLDTDVSAVIADVWTRTFTYRPMTQLELNARDDAVLAAETTEATDEALFLLFNAIVYLAKNPHNASATVGQIFNALQNPANQAVDRSTFLAKKKELRFPA